MNDNYRQLIVVSLLTLSMLIAPMFSLKAANASTVPSDAPAPCKPLQILWNFFIQVTGQKDHEVKPSELAQEPVASAAWCDKGMVIDPNGGDGCSQ